MLAAAFLGMHITYLSCYLISKIIKFLIKTTNGNALGSLGLIIAFLGLIGEFYQIISIQKIYYALTFFIILNFLIAILFFKKK